MEKPAELNNRQWKKLLALVAAMRRDEEHSAPEDIFDNETGELRKTMGGAYANGQRESMGYTGRNVAETKALLRSQGLRVATGEAEGILQQALYAIDGGLCYSIGMGKSASAAWIAKKRAEKPAGECLTCKNPAADGKRCCRECMQKANERQKRARERKGVAVA